MVLKKSFIQFFINLIYYIFFAKSLVTSERNQGQEYQQSNRKRRRKKQRLFEIIPSFSIAIIRTMKGGKSYSHIKARSTKPSCKKVELKNYMKVETKKQELNL